MLKPEEVQKLIAALKDKVGKKVKLLVRLEVRDVTLGNMGADGDPRISGSEIEIVFRGVFGLGQRPLYIHGIDIDGKSKVFRCDSDCWLDEDTGNTTHQDCTTLEQLDDVDIRAWFMGRTMSDDEHAFIAKVRAAEPENKYLAERILNGQPDYRPPSNSPRYYPSYFMFENPAFVQHALRHLERIV